MKVIAPHLQLAVTKIANAWLLRDAQGQRFLIDTGHPFERLALLADLWGAGIRAQGDLTAILLTHRHSDHAGNAAFIRKRFGARVYCHKEDADILRGKKNVMPLGTGKAIFFKNWLCQFEDRHPAFTEVDDVYTEGAWRWGFNIVAVPGHTDGSVMLYHEPTQTLFSGDSILAGLPLARKSKSLSFADPAFSSEPEAARRSVKRFLSNMPKTEILCSGHGPVVDEAVQQKLRKLLRDG